MLPCGVESPPFNVNVVAVVPAEGEIENAAVGAPGFPTISTIDAEPVEPLPSVAMAVKTNWPDCVYTCCTVATLPLTVPRCPSPKSNVIDVIAFPDVGVAVTVNVVTVFGVGLVGETLTVTTREGRALTVTDVVVVDESPSASKPVTTTRYERCEKYV